MKNNLQRGFTLVELLIVITLIGILATAVLAAINPIEQMRKGRDTNSVALVSNINTALLAYYGSTAKYPFNTAPATAKLVFWNYSAGAAGTSGLKDVNDSLSADLKATVFSKVSTSSIFVGNLGTSDPIVCYIPESLAAQQAAKTSANYNGFKFNVLTITGVPNSVTATYTPSDIVPGTTVCSWAPTSAAPVGTVLCALCNN